jgi:hypothetical protein
VEQSYRLLAELCKIKAKGITTDRPATFAGKMNMAGVFFPGHIHFSEGAGDLPAKGVLREACQAESVGRRGDYRVLRNYLNQRSLFYPCEFN